MLTELRVCADGSKVNVPVSVVMPDGEVNVAVAPDNV